MQQWGGGGGAVRVRGQKGSRGDGAGEKRGTWGGVVVVVAEAAAAATWQSR